MTFLETKEAFGPYTKVTVTADSSVSMSIIPEMGARLNNFIIPTKDGVVDIIDGYESVEELTTEYYSKSSLLAPFPNRLADGTYEFMGSRYQLPLNKTDEGNAIHGFVSNKPFTLRRSEAVGQGYELELCYTSESVEGYPFVFEVTVVYLLTESGTLRISTNVKNSGESPLPFGLGWHPYFTTGTKIDDLELRLPIVEKLEVDNRLIPTGETEEVLDWTLSKSLSGVQFDTGFAFVSEDKTVRLHDASKNLTVAINFLEGYQYVQVFTPPWRTAIAIEPMTCAANAFNNKQGLQVLNPGESQPAVFEILVQVS